MYGREIYLARNQYCAHTLSNRFAVFPNFYFDAHIAEHFISLSLITISIFRFLSRIQMRSKPEGLTLEPQVLRTSQESLITNTMTLQLEFPICEESHYMPGNSVVEKIRIKEDGVVSSHESTEDFSFQSLKIGPILGRGSQAKVRKALHVESNVIYALKQFTGSDCIDSMKKTFIMELRNIISLPPHKNLVQSYQAFFRNGHFMILMEYMKNGTLKELYNRVGPLSESTLRVVACDLLSGLSFLVKCGIVHRDIKPSNILISSDCIAKISDFGVSTYVTASILQNTVSSVGSHLYMAPERLRGDPYSFPSDVWSIGVTIAECFLGRYPFVNTEEIDPFYLSNEIVDGLAQVQWSREPSYELKDFLSQCLTHEPSKRPRAHELLNHKFVQSAQRGFLQEKFVNS